MTNRIYKDDTEALEGANESLNIYRDRYLSSDSSRKFVDEEIAAIKRVIASTQDVERRIVEARIASMQDAFDLLSKAFVETGSLPAARDRLVLRISELRASLAKVAEHAAAKESE